MPPTNAPSPRNAALATASVAIADGQQLRLGTIPCASDGAVLRLPGRKSSRPLREGASISSLSPNLPDVIDPPLH